MALDEGRVTLQCTQVGSGCACEWPGRERDHAQDQPAQPGAAQYAESRHRNRKQGEGRDTA